MDIQFPTLACVVLCKIFETWVGILLSLIGLSKKISQCARIQ